MDLIEFIQIISIFWDNAIEAAELSQNPTLSLAYFRDMDRIIFVVENSTLEDKINTREIFLYGKSSKGENRGI